MLRRGTMAGEAGQTVAGRCSNALAGGRSGLHRAGWRL